MRKCPRTLDKPILLFGLEVEDVAVLALFAGIAFLFLDPLVPGVIFFGGWLVLYFLKRDKPTGYVIHLLYKFGFRLEGLIPSPRKVSRYCACSKKESREEVRGG